MAASITPAAARGPSVQPTRRPARPGARSLCEGAPMTAVLRYTAFADDPAGGNPAGVVLDAGALDDAAMLALAAEVGYSETAFVTRDRGDGALDVRYFSPLAEVPFCGHATIATGVAWAERHGAGRLALRTVAGEVVVDVAHAGRDGRLVAT